MTDTIELSKITPELAAQNIQAFAAEGRLVQRQWHARGGDGREIACLLGSIHHDINDPRKCPGNLMPAWMAYLTVRLFDGIPVERVAVYAQAYADSLRRWGELNAATWERVRIDFIGQVHGVAFAKALSLQPTPPAEYWPEVSALHDRIRAWILAPKTLTINERRKLGGDARELRQRLWNIRLAKPQEARVEAAAEAVEADEAAVEVVAEAVEAAVAAAEVELAEVAAVARSTSYAASFDALLAAIKQELAACSDGREAK